MAIYIIYKRLVLDFPRVRDYNIGRLTCVKEERKMKIHKNNATHRGVSKRSTYFLLYTAAFLICSACIYVWFARTGRSLISTGDGWKQHFPAFVYFGQYGRTVLRTLLTEHQLVLPQWNFSLGYGGDILTTLHYLCNRRPAGPAEHCLSYPVRRVSLQLFVPVPAVPGRAGLRRLLPV